MFQSVKPAAMYIDPVQSWSKNVPRAPLSQHVHGVAETDAVPCLPEEDRPSPGDVTADQEDYSGRPQSHCTSGIRDLGSTVRAGHHEGVRDSGITKVQQMDEQMNYMQMENNNPSDRMASVEMNMHEILQHLRGLSVKS
eukprot:s154_g11.t1